MQSILHAHVYSGKRSSQFLKAFAFCVLLLCISGAVNAQSQKLSKNHPLKQAAPHLPVMERATKGTVVYGEKFSYKMENETAIKNWIANYPKEVQAYKKVIAKFLAATVPSTLSPAQLETYYDLKAQSDIISQYAN